MVLEQLSPVLQDFGIDTIVPGKDERSETARHCSGWTPRRNSRLVLPPMKEAMQDRYRSAIDTFINSGTLSYNKSLEPARGAHSNAASNRVSVRELVASTFLQGVQ